MKKIFLSALLAASAVITVPAHAYVINFDFTNTNVAGGDFSGKTSPLLGADNVAAPGSQLFVDTFGAKNGGGNSFGCGLDTPSSLVNLSGGTYGFRTGYQPGVAAPPAGDSGCYAYGPGPGGALPDAVRITYLGLPPGIAPGSKLNYIGLYYGSIDTYNDIIFYDENNKKLVTITGSSLINQFHGISGNRDADSTNIYVNIFFNENETFRDFEFVTKGRAFEFDNLAVGFNQVLPNKIPEPGSFALLGLGLAGLCATRRRTK